MIPEQQHRLTEFLNEILPTDYYVVENDDYVEIHKREVEPETQVKLF